MEEDRSQSYLRDARTFSSIQLDLEVVCHAASRVPRGATGSQPPHGHHEHPDAMPAMPRAIHPSQDSIMYKGEGLQGSNQNCPPSVKQKKRQYEGNQAVLELGELLHSAVATSLNSLSYTSQGPACGVAPSHGNVCRGEPQGDRWPVMPEDQPWPGEFVGPCLPLSQQAQQEHIAKVHSASEMKWADKESLFAACVDHTNMDAQDNAWAKQELVPTVDMVAPWGSDCGIRVETRRCDDPQDTLGMALSDWPQCELNLVDMWQTSGAAAQHDERGAVLDILPDILIAPQSDTERVLYKKCRMTGESDDYDLSPSSDCHLQLHEPAGSSHRLRSCGDVGLLDISDVENRLWSDANHLAKDYFGNAETVLYCSEDTLSEAWGQPRPLKQQVSIDPSIHTSARVRDSTSRTSSSSSCNLACTESLELTTSPAPSATSHAADRQTMMSLSQWWYESRPSGVHIPMKKLEMRKRAWRRKTHKEMQTANAYLGHAQLPGQTQGTHVHYTHVTREMVLYEIGVSVGFSGSAVCLAHSYLLRMEIVVSNEDTKEADLVAICVCLFLASQVCDPMCIDILVEMLQRVTQRPVSLKEARDLQFDYLGRLNFRLGPYFQVGWNCSNGDVPMVCT